MRVLAAFSTSGDLDPERGVADAGNQSNKPEVRCALSFSRANAASMRSPHVGMCWTSMPCISFNILFQLQ